ncbi:MAG: prohibitin family protein, partial [Actinobacteria bacterium]|nr:prohibitin family protein [Actinomycetota bacterium]
NALTEQNNIAKQEAIKQQTIINAQAEAEKKKIEAEGEAEAIRLKQEALAQNPLVIQYEFVQKLSPNVTWGVLPDSVVPLLDLKSLSQGK